MNISSCNQINRKQILIKDFKKKNFKHIFVIITLKLLKYKIMNAKILVAIFGILFFGCGIAVAKDKKKDDKKETVTFDVSMTCENCKKRIEKNIAFEKGITDMSVDLPKKTVTIEFKKDKTSIENIQKAFEKLGYTATVHQEKKEGN